MKHQSLPSLTHSISLGAILTLFNAGLTTPIASQEYHATPGARISSTYDTGGHELGRIDYRPARVDVFTSGGKYIRTQTVPADWTTVFRCNT